MNPSKRKALESAGWQFGDAEDFLNTGSMKRKKNKSVKKPEYKSPTQLLVEDLQAKTNAVISKLTLLQTKLMIAKAMEQQGSNMASVAEKLNISVEKVKDFFDPEKDIEIRFLAVMGFALNRQITAKFNDKNLEKAAEQASDNDEPWEDE